MMQNALINIPKLRLLLVPEQDSSLREQSHHVLEARVVKINEAFATSSNHKRYRTIHGFYDSSTM